jgi:D-serine deaminase-like pyridoxal phosphate-dependent protein
MDRPVNKSRRKMVLGSLALGALGAGILAKPNDLGKNHEPYFTQLSQALDRAQFSKPTLVIDKNRLESNVAALKNHIGERFDYRVVAKSLPSLSLLETVMNTSNTQRLMLFHQPFLTQVAASLPHSDVLMGKPMPVVAANNFYQAHNIGAEFKADRQLQWLIDSPARLIQYQRLAKRLGISMNINIELDVGLHRGGVQHDRDLVEMLNIIKAESTLNLSGFMGYEPHIAKIPFDKIRLRDKAMAIYSHKLDVAQQIMQHPLNDLTLNAGGSPTYRLYKNGKFPHNELSAGSCLVKPTDFDLSDLVDHQAAAFIATPVIKAMEQTELPGIDYLGKLMSAWNPNLAQAFFYYGGYWKAKPESPKGLTLNPVFGHSSNQEMLNGSRRIKLNPDDWIFLRPTQSESVFLQFGDIAVYDQGEIVDQWPVLAS